MSQFDTSVEKLPSLRFGLSEKMTQYLKGVGGVMLWTHWKGILFAFGTSHCPAPLGGQGTIWNWLISSNSGSTLSQLCDLRQVT